MRRGWPGVWRNCAPPSPGIGYTLLEKKRTHAVTSFRKEFRSIADEVGRVRFGPKSPVIVLFSLEENNKFRIMC